ncbi:AIPR family protein [Streptomyces sp. AM8-1-1]|uniref:AIPR family protein n=1 Tax=Streptomyces sp. AM8-1-1 TaxID=3075825 RepID=UPI0028C41649|nr:AIPR family protein [Streptomyces sp. AM8-1-1]WNO73090.1 AIPR family protein [Streptomyces sp. AM8-1-1]
MDDALPETMRFVREHLVRTYTPYIDQSDLAPQYGDTAFFVRALAAQAVSILTDSSPEEAASSVVDGPGDSGIDAIAFSSGGTDIWFVQAKWSIKGAARLSEQDAALLVTGLQRLADRRYDGFNSRIDALSSRIDEALSSPRCRVHLVVALAGDGRLSHRAEQQLTLVGKHFGFDGRTPVKVHTLGLADLHSAARMDTVRTVVSLKATLTDGWYSVHVPYQAYVASIAAGEVASWFGAHRDRLFAPSLRQHSVSQPNPVILNQLITEPEDFWYLNQGITLICDRAAQSYLGRRAQGQPLRLELTNVRVVAGAQTVASVAHAVERSPEVADRALVPLRIICLDDASPDLRSKFTQAGEADSPADSLDALAHDPIQQGIRNGFMHFLNKEYVYRKDAVAPAPDAGCTVQEAAVALACSHPDVSLAARASADPSYLWRPAPEGAYTRLFGGRPSVHQIWQSVLLLRQVRTVLAHAAAGESTRMRDLFDHGDLLIAHLVFQSLGPDTLEDVFEEAAYENWLAERTMDIALRLGVAIEDRYGQHLFLASVFTDEHKCRGLAEDVTGSFANEPPRPRQVPPGRKRRPNSVAVLVDHRRILEGTRLLYQPDRAQEHAIGEWLREDPSRYLATWTNDAHLPLTWAVDQQAYTPSGLLRRIWSEAGWDQAPSAVQGSRYWVVPDEGSLADMAEALLPLRRRGGAY